MSSEPNKNAPAEGLGQSDGADESAGAVVLCANCGEREGTLRWGDSLAVTHGWSVLWCEPCALRKQIEHAEERAAALPGLRDRLAALEANHA